MTQTIEQTETTNQSKIEAIISAIQTAEARARELKASIRDEESEQAPNFQNIAVWQAEANTIEGRRLPALRGDYAQAVKVSRGAELAGLRAQLSQLGDRIGPLQKTKMELKPQLDQAIFTAERTGAGWAEVARLAARYALPAEEVKVIDAQMLDISNKVFVMEREN